MRVSRCASVPHALQRSDCAEWADPMYRVSEGVRSTHGQDGAIVLDIQHGQMFNLNRVGSRMFELLEMGSAEPEIVEAISQEFSVSREMVEDDVREFIGALKKNRLVTET
jgi:Coenzyme PQQ synthesis protein D (PqqD)